MKKKVDEWNEQKFEQKFCKLAFVRIATKRRRTMDNVRCSECIHYGTKHCILGKEVEINDSKS